MENATKDYGKLAVNVSLYSGCCNPTPLRTVFLPDFLTKTSPYLYNCILSLRNGKDSAIKKRLPAVTISGEFKYRKSTGLIRHSGLICLDFDKVEDTRECKRALSLLPYISFAAESSSGNGVFAIVPISRPDMHDAHFEALKEEMDKVGLKIDAAARDVTRLRIYSYDPDYYINPNSEVFSKVKNLELKRTFTSYARGSDESRFMQLLQIIEGTGTDITDRRDYWRKIGMAIASNFGESGRDYFLRISRFYSKFKPWEANKQYDSFLRGGYQACTLNSIFWIAKQYGVVING